MINAEKMYKEIVSYIKTLENADGLMGCIEKCENGISVRIPEAALVNIAIELRNEIKAKSAKRNGNGDLYKFAKYASKFLPNNHTKVCHKCGDTYWIGCGYFAISSETNCEIETETKNPMLFNKVYEPCTMIDRIAIPTPTLSELKTFIKLYKAENAKPKSGWKIFWDFGENLPMVNAEYLLEILKVMGDDCEITIAKNDTKLIAPILLKSEKNNAILLPVRKTK